MSVTYVASITGRVRAGDDAKAVQVIPLKALNPDLIKLAFDHADFVRDYVARQFSASPRAGTSLCPTEDRRGELVTAG